jgi:hypothetical protein
LLIKKPKIYTIITGWFLVNEMLKHEEKYCPCCGACFECKVGSIILCQCSQLKLTEKERDYVREQYQDCLCFNCMSKLKKEYHQLPIKNKLNKILKLLSR